MIVPPLDKIADGDLFIADVCQQKRLDTVDVPDAKPVEFGPKEIEKPPVEALDETGQLKVFLFTLVFPCNIFGLYILPKSP